MIEKALPREGFRNAFFKRQKTLKNIEKPMQNRDFQKSKYRCRKPYETNSILVLFGTESRKVITNHWKKDPPSGGLDGTCVTGTRQVIFALHK